MQNYEEKSAVTEDIIAANQEFGFGKGRLL